MATKKISSTPSKSFEITFTSEQVQTWPPEMRQMLYEVVRPGSFGFSGRELRFDQLSNVKA
jgi:hypothetical protein